MSYIGSNHHITQQLCTLSSKSINPSTLRFEYMDYTIQFSYFALKYFKSIFNILGGGFTFFRKCV